MNENNCSILYICCYIRRKIKVCSRICAYTLRNSALYDEHLTFQYITEIVANTYSVRAEYLISLKDIDNDKWVACYRFTSNFF